MKQISEENFDELIKATKIVVIDFYADWCAPCRGMLPILENVNKSFEDNEDVEIYKCNVDENSSIASDLNIRNIPTLIFMTDGIPKVRKVGTMTEEVFVDQINQLLNE